MGKGSGVLVWEEVLSSILVLLPAVMTCPLFPVTCIRDARK